MNDQTVLTDLIHSNHASHPIKTRHTHESQTAVSISCHPVPQDGFAPQFVRYTQSRWELNGLYLALSNMIGHGESIRQMFQYNLGTSKWNGGSTIFWQQRDNNPNVYTGGLIVKFDPQSGEPVDQYYTTVQDVLQDCYGVQMSEPPVPNLIGDHLIKVFPTKPIIICHNPITALIGNHHLKQYTWLATPEHPLVDLTGPSFVTALPTSAPLLLLAEPGHEEQWSRAHYVLKAFLSIYPERRIDLLIASSLPGFFGSYASMARWITCDPHSANWIIDCTVNGLTFKLI